MSLRGVKGRREDQTALYVVSVTSLAEAIAREVHVDVSHGFPEGFTAKDLAATLLSQSPVIAIRTRVHPTNEGERSSLRCIWPDCGATIAVRAKSRDGRRTARAAGWSVSEYAPVHEGRCPAHRYRHIPTDSEPTP